MPEFMDSTITMFSAGEGGRENALEDPAGTYAPHLRTAEHPYHLGVRLIAAPEGLTPGRDRPATWELIYTGIDYSSLVPGAEFEIIEGLRVVGQGRVANRWEDSQVTFDTVFGSDVDRDGVFLELNRTAGHEREPIVEVFYSDADGRFTFTAYAAIELPLDVVEELIRNAHDRLPERRQDK